MLYVQFHLLSSASGFSGSFLANIPFKNWRHARLLQLNICLAAFTFVAPTDLLCSCIWGLNVSSRKQCQLMLFYCYSSVFVNSGDVQWRSGQVPGSHAANFPNLFPDSDHSHPPLNSERMRVLQLCTQNFSLAKWWQPYSCESWTLLITAVSRATMWFPGECWQVPMPPPQAHRQQISPCGGQS